MGFVELKNSSQNKHSEPQGEASGGPEGATVLSVHCLGLQVPAAYAFRIMSSAVKSAAFLKVPRPKSFS